MSDDILLEQDGRILRATFNRTPDNGVSDSMAGSSQRLFCLRMRIQTWFC